MIRRAVVALAALPLFISGCMEPPKAAQEDIDIRNQWAAKVPPQVRDQAVAEANRHPSWGERRRLEFEVSEYQKYLKDEDRKSRLKRPTTKSTTRASAAPKEWSPTTAPSVTPSPATTRSTRRSTTRRATTAPASSVPATAPAQ